MKASDFKVGDRYKIEYEVEYAGKTYVESKPVGRAITVRMRHSDGDSLDFAFDHVPAPIKPEAGQVWFNDDYEVRIIFADDKTVVYELERDAFAYMAGERFCRTREEFDVRSYRLLQVLNPFNLPVVYYTTV